MTVRGTVRDGIIILEKAIQLPNGTEVEVIVPDEVGGKPTLLGLLELAGTVNDLPADMAKNHDHYLHGQPKK